MPETSRPTVRELVLVPAVITLGVTILRLVGELQHWDQRFFNRAGGGGGALVGISWLPFLFGGYFAYRLLKAGEGPASRGRAFGMVALAFAILFAVIFAGNALKLPPTVIIVSVCLVSVPAGWIASRGWPALGKVLFAYALAARVPVALLMLPAIIGKWGTHYDALPPNFPAFNPVVTWALVGLFPQMTLWIGMTLVCGGLVAALTAAVMWGSRRTAVADAA